MAEPPNNAWRQLSAVDRARLQDKLQRYLPMVLISVLAVPVIGFVIAATTGNIFAALPFMLIGVLGPVGPFILVGVVMFVFAKKFMAARSGGGGDAADLGLPIPEAPQPSGQPGEEPPLAPESAALLAGIDGRRAALGEQAQAMSRLIDLAAMVLVPCALALGLFTDGGNNLLPAAIISAVCYFLARGLTTQHFQKQFSALFKQTMLPQLLDRHDLAALDAAEPLALEGATQFGLIPAYDVIRRDDAFRGAHRGATVTIAEFAALYGSRVAKPGQWRPKGAHVVAQGLLVQAQFPGNVAAVTIVKRALDKPPPDLQRIGLEDPEFEEIYRIWGSDQIGSRAALTPAVMQRLKLMANSTDLLPPILLLESDTLTLIFGKANARNLFEPGDVTDADMSRHLKQIVTDLDEAMMLVDELLDVIAQMPGVRLDQTPTEIHP
ncbi:MAG: DUF3137 domain-containing protein [Devosia sp.]|uniref:DUF3137 domain-containing protein n=1 Tax=Devosia sp. TaxID=1871048 RepID=UPI0024CC5927|nr:DUF3137 domain-containing protein [Devosia sp.]UYN99836.1 MAG: DUF3137 domain-containing protein [Devosia sp.]